MFIADLKLYKYLTQKRSEKIADSVIPFIKNEGRLLDLGGGNMMTAAAIAKARPELEIWGIDVIEDQNLLRKLPQNVHFSTYDGSSIPYDSRSFDQALVCSTLHHTPSPEFFMNELMRILKPGGNLIVVEEMYSHYLDLLWIAGLDWVLNKLKRGVPVPLNFRTYRQYQKTFSDKKLKQIAHSSVRPAFPWQKLEIYQLRTP